jgi:hypothetical protein
VLPEPAIVDAGDCGIHESVIPPPPPEPPDKFGPPALNLDPPLPPPADVIVENIEGVPAFPVPNDGAGCPAPPAPIVIGIDAPQTEKDVQVLKPPAPPPPPMLTPPLPPPATTAAETNLVPG